MAVDKSDWHEKAIRVPAWPGTPEDINAVLRALFPHDVLLDYQRRIVEAALREAVGDFRRVLDRKMSGGSTTQKATKAAVEMVLSEFDPEHKEWGGFYPAQLLCSEHESAVETHYTPVFEPCPGVPWCNAHRGVEVQP